MNLKFIHLQEKDLHFVKDLYNYYILNSTATFHTTAVSTEELKKFIPVNHPRYSSFLIEYEGRACGYCYLSQYKPRKAYDRTAEITVYLKPEYHGKGIGKTTMNMLEEIAKQKDICVLTGFITDENQGSIRLFEKCGYQKCAHFRQVGEKFNRLLDVVGYQKIIG